MAGKMTFEEFQELTTEQKLEVSMAHLAGVLRSQAGLSDEEMEELRRVPSENEFGENTVTIEKRGGEKTISYGRRYSPAGMFAAKGISERSVVSMSAKSGRFLTIRERGAWSAAHKPKPVKKA